MAGRHNMTKFRGMCAYIIMLMGLHTALGGLGIVFSLVQP